MKNYKNQDTLFNVKKKIKLKTKLITRRKKYAYKNSLTWRFIKKKKNK